MGMIAGGGEDFVQPASLVELKNSGRRCPERLCQLRCEPRVPQNRNREYVGAHVCATPNASLTLLAVDVS